MKNIAISKFKAHCLEIIDKINHNHKQITITKRGKPIARIVPIISDLDNNIIGMLKGQAKITSDITGPIGENWSAENE